MQRRRRIASSFYGDTNSTLAGALAAAKLAIPVAHVEAGLRSYVRDMPEEINRIVADRLSALLFAPTQNAVDNLAREGMTAGVSLTGDIMYDALLQHAPVAAEKSRAISDLALTPGGYVLRRHRVANTDDPQRPTSSTLAPCTSGRLPCTQHAPRSWVRISKWSAGAIIDPVGYLDMLALEQGARMVLTDPAACAYLLGVP
jgi:UDP-N-acetylglucosamine 2-epimerase